MARCFPLVVTLALSGCMAEEPGDEVGQRNAALAPVTWTDLVGVSATVGGLSKTAPETLWNAGAVSVQTLAGDGFVEFTSDENTTDKQIGLSSGNGGPQHSDIDFAIRLKANGAAMVYEGGAALVAIGSYSPGIVFRVQAEDGVVTYWRNGVLKYTSALAPTFPLLVDTSLRTPGATLTDVKIEPIDFWTAPVGVSVDGRDITKTAPENQFNAGAVSLNTIPSGDGYVEFRAADESSFVAAGLSSGNSNQGLGDIDFAIHLNPTGGVTIFEGGVNVASVPPYHAGDVFRVQVSGGVVTYYRNRVLLYTSAGTPTYPLLLDASIRTPGASILGARLVSGYVTDDCSPYQESLPVPDTQFSEIDAEADVLVAGDSMASPPLAHVYRQTPDGWVLEQSLTKPAAPTQETWGNRPATDGTTIAVRGGAVFQEAGYFQLHRHDGAEWVRNGRIDPCPDGDDDGLTDSAVLGDVFAVREATPNRVRIYRRAGTSWALDGVVTPPPGGQFGAVALGGNRLFVVTSVTGGQSLVQVYRHNPALADPPPTDPCGTANLGKWRLKPSPVADSGHFFDRLAASRAGTRLIVSDLGIEDAHVYELDGGDWVQVAVLTHTPFDPNFGPILQFGGPGGDTFAVVGGSATWLFARTDDGWTQVSYTNYFGTWVAATDDTVFTADRAALAIQVHGIDPLCAAE